MKIPAKVKIGAYTIPISLTKKLKVEGERCLGAFYHTEMMIKLDTECSKSILDYSFWHEVIHAIDTNHLIGLKEKQVSSLAEGIYAFLKDNGYIK